MGKDNEFEPVQSDARIAALEQKLSEAVSTMDSKMQSMQDGFAKIDQVLTSDSFKKVLNFLDTGTDEAEAGTVSGESGARSLRRLLHIDNAKTGVDAFIRSMSNDWSRNDEFGAQRLLNGQVINHDFSARLGNERLWTNLIFAKSITGEELDSEKTLALLRFMAENPPKNTGNASEEG